MAKSLASDEASENASPLKFRGDSIRKFNNLHTSPTIASRLQSIQRLFT